MGEVVFLWFSPAPVHRQAGAPPAALLSSAGYIPHVDGLAILLYETFSQKAMVPKSRQSFPQPCVFRRCPEKRGKVGLLLSHRYSVISRWGFGCPGSCIPPSRGAGEARDGDEIPFRGTKRFESYSQCKNGHVMICHLDREI